MNEVIIGTCNICGGPVKTYHVWNATTPPPKWCGHCGARASYGPTIPMQTSTTKDVRPHGAFFDDLPLETQVEIKRFWKGDKNAD